MGIKFNKCHMALFGNKQCLKVLEIFKKLKKE